MLDNAEHVVDAAAALVSQWLQTDPGATVLATSQRRLAVAGERVRRVEPLVLPLDSDALDLHRGAVALFVERARTADHRFEPTPAQWPLLREICRRLDGLPLALEMAAARVPVLGLRGLAQALERRLALLTGGRRDAARRHHTLQAALDWSHDLLSADEQRLYRLCGVFAGGFTLELLVDVAGGGAAPERRWAVIDTLAQLVDRSLAALARRYLAPGAGTPDLRDLLQAEHGNLREAIARGRQQAEDGLRADTVSVAIGAAQAALFTAWRLEAMQWLESCEALAEGPGMPAALRVHWWNARARQWLVSQSKDAVRVAERAMALAQAIGDDRDRFAALANLVRSAGGPKDTLRPHCEAMRALLAGHPEWDGDATMQLEMAGVEANAMYWLRDKEGLLRCRLRELELARRHGHAQAALAAETNVVFALQSLGRHEEALQRARELTARLGDSESGNAAYAWTGLIVALQTLGRHAEFRAALPRAARVLRQHGLPFLGPQCALVLAAEGRTLDALRVLGHARDRLAAKRMAMTAEELAGLGALEQQARAALGDPAVELALTEGATLDEAAVDALMLGRAGIHTATPGDSLL